MLNMIKLEKLWKEKRKTLKILGLVGVVAAFSTASAEAVVLVDQPVTSDVDGFLATSAAGVLNADDFSVSYDFTLQDISWWGFYDPDVDADAFEVKIYSDLAGDPGALLHSITPVSVTRNTTGFFEPFTTDIYKYDLDLATEIDLDAGTYYISISNDTFNSDWYWAFSTDVTNDTSWYDDQGIWIADFTDLAFSLSGERQVSNNVPEPAPFALLLIGMALLRAKRRNC